MSKYSSIPQSKYGILIQDQFSSELEEVAEQVRRLGYAVLDSGLTSEQLREVSDKFNLVRERYLKTWGESRLKSLNEIHTIRALLTQKKEEEGGGNFCS